MNKTPPIAPAKISVRRCSFLEAVGVKAGEGDEIECVGSGRATGGFTGRGESLIGSSEGEGEGVKKLLEGDSDGDDFGDFDGDGEGEFDNGDGESGESEDDTEAAKGLRSLGIPTSLALAGFRKLGNISSLR